MLSLLFLDLNNDYWLMFLHMKYETNEGNSSESYRHIYILVAAEQEGWVVIESPALKQTLNKTINHGQTVIELPQLLKSSNITKVENKGIYLKASVPVSVFGYNEEAGNKEGFYVIPAHSLSTEYMATTYTPMRGSLIGIVGTEDNTKLNILLKMTGSLSYNGHNYSNTDILKVELNKGMTFILSHQSDLTGTYIKSSKRISVISGNQCAFYTNDIHCDPLRELLIPIDKWGNEFIVPFLNFKDPKGILRIVANDSNTRVLIADNTTTTTRSLSNGDFLDVKMTTEGPFYVKSDRSIQVSIIVNGAFSRSRNGFMSLVPAFKHYDRVYKFVIPSTGMFDNCLDPYTRKKTRFIVITAESYVMDNILYDNSRLPINSTVRNIQLGYKIYSTLIIPGEGGYHTLHSIPESYKFGVIIYCACYSYVYGYGFPGGLNLNWNTFV